MLQKEIQNITCKHLPGATSGLATVGLVEQNSEVPWLADAVFYGLNAQMMTPCGCYIVLIQCFIPCLFTL